MTSAHPETAHPERSRGGRPLLVVNPAGAGGRAGRLFPELRRPIAHYLGEVDVVFTDRPGHATELARHAASEGRERIVAVGGDGTFSEVVSGAAESQSAVGLIHLGTGGDFRRTLGLEHRPDRYLEAIARNDPRPIDLGRVTIGDSTRWFVNVLSLGMGGLVDEYVSGGPRDVGAKAAYFLASLKALAKGAVGRLAIELTLDGVKRTEHVETRMIAICNGRFFGGGMEIAPMANVDDGVFEIVAITGAGRLPLLELSNDLYKGQHLERSSVTHLRANELSLRLVNDDESARFPLDVDGEPADFGPLTVSVVPGAVRVLV